MERRLAGNNPQIEVKPKYLNKLMNNFCEGIDPYLAERHECDFDDYNDLYNYDLQLSKRESKMEQTFLQSEKTNNLLKFSYFKGPVKNILPKAAITLDQLYQVISSPKYFQKKTEKFRELTDPVQIKNYKSSHFDYVTFSGTFTSRKSEAIVKPSGLLVIDLDNIDVPSVKRDLLADTDLPLALGFTSPSGKGYKAVYEVNLIQAPYIDWFSAISAYLFSRYRYQVDQSGKDIARACFICYDNEAYFNFKR